MPLFARRRLIRPEDRGPLNVMFVITSMPVGGAETLLVNLVRRFDRERFSPELCCLKEFGPLGEVLAREIPAFERLIRHKYDFGVVGRLAELMRRQKIDAVVTVGTGGDKMFWGRLAAWRVGMPVILSSLHSTGLPDHVELPNRLLAPISDGFIGCAPSHGEYLIRAEGCPRHKVFSISNGVDVERFRPLPPPVGLRERIGLPADAPAAAIVAALRPEKNHELFLQAAAHVVRRVPKARFLIIGDGPRRAALEQRTEQLGLSDAVHFLGTRSDVPELLSLVDVLVLSSHMEANPVSILEGSACGKPIVATRVGSIPETVRHGENGFLVDAGNDRQLAEWIEPLLTKPELARQMGHCGRELVVENWSLDKMVEGYQNLIHSIYLSKLDASVTPSVLSPSICATAESQLDVLGAINPK